MEEVKRTYITDEQNRRLAVQIDIGTFNKIEEVLENYALVQLMEESTNGEALGLDEAVTSYRTLELQRRRAMTSRG
jgi:RelB Antitoxin alpha helical domain